MNPFKKPLHQERIEDAARLKALYQSRKKALGISQTSIAEALGITQGAVAQYMNADVPLNAQAAAIFAREMRVLVDDFSPSFADEIREFSKYVSDKKVPKTDFNEEQTQELSAGDLRVLSTLQSATLKTIQKLMKEKKFGDGECVDFLARCKESGHLT